MSSPTPDFESPLHVPSIFLNIDRRPTSVVNFHTNTCSSESLFHSSSFISSGCILKTSYLCKVPVYLLYSDVFFLSRLRGVWQSTFYPLRRGPFGPFFPTTPHRTSSHSFRHSSDFNPDFLRITYLTIVPVTIKTFFDKLILLPSLSVWY